MILWPESCSKMEVVKILKPFFSLLVSLSVVATASFARAENTLSRLEATSFIPVPTTVGELSDSQLEKALVSEIHRIADKAFAEIKAKDPHAKVTQLKKVERAVIHRLKETGKLIELARSLNPKIGISVVATEIVVTVAGFGLISTGQVLAGSVILNFPSVPLMLSVLLAYEVQKIKWQIGKELKTSIRDLEKIRKEVIGYNVKNKITSLILNDGAVQRELELVVKPVKNQTQAPELVTLSEIEKAIGRTADGESFLAHAYYERGQKEIYASLLLQYLNDSQESLSSLLEEISNRSKEVNAEQKAPELRKHLMALSDIKKHIDRELIAARKEISATKKKVKKGQLSKAEGIEMRNHLKAELLRLQEVRIQAFRHQYAVLLATKEAYLSGNKVEVAKLVAKNKTELAELKVMSSFARIREVTRAAELPIEFKGETSKGTIRSCQQIFSAAR